MEYTCMMHNRCGDHGTNSQVSHIETDDAPSSPAIPPHPVLSHPIHSIRVELVTYPQPVLTHSAAFMRKGSERQSSYQMDSVGCVVWQLIACW